jgi:hypothetical protein
LLRQFQLAQKRCGFPGLRSIKGLDKFKFQLSLQGWCTDAAISNIKNMVKGNRPRVAMMDEIAISPSPRYCAATNQLVGLCWQHGAHCDLAVDSEAGLQVLHTAVQEKTVHRAEEASVIALTGVGKDGYSARPIAALPHCKYSDHMKQLKLLTDFLESYWDADGPHEQYGPLLCLSSDGASVRRRALHQLFEVELLPSSSPLHHLLSPLELLDLHCSAKFRNMTVDFDQKHLGKRLREAIKSPSREIKIMGVTLNRYA